MRQGNAHGCSVADSLFWRLQEETHVELVFLGLRKMKPLALTHPAFETRHRLPVDLDILCNNIQRFAIVDYDT